MKRLIKKITDKIPIKFELSCPDCGGKMKDEFLDMQINKLVYKCESCGKEWV